MAVELWSKSGSSSTVVSTGGLPIGTTTVTVQNPMTAANGIYIPSGGTSSVVGNYQIITFTGSGTFTPAYSGNVELMMIGGGGGGITNAATGGAGSGGMIYYGSNPWIYRSGTALTLSAGTTYTVVIGGGGGNTGTNAVSTYGGNTTLSGGSINLLAYGGAGATGGVDELTGAGGAGSRYYSAQLSGYYFNAPQQGYPAGNGGSSGSTSRLAGGGGTGSMGTSGLQLYIRSFGGNGFLTDISGTINSYGGGGGGGVATTTAATGGPGGTGGGGAGASISSGSSGTLGGNGTTNTGGGGGGGGYQSTNIVYYSGGAGGSGVLIMKIPLYSTISVGNIANISTTGATVTTNGDYKTATFTGSGSFTVVNSQTNAIVEYLVVAGGGGGGRGDSTGTGGGGGGGGFLEWTWGVATGADFVGPKLEVNTGETYSVTVGSGGPGGTNAFSNATQIAQFGGNTSIACTSYASNAFYVSSLGGGGGGFGGGDNSTTTRKYHGGSGGSGGGKGAGGLFGFGESGTAVLSPRQGYSAYVAIGLSVSGSYTYGAGAGGPGVSSAGPGRASVINGSTYSAGGTINTTGTAGSANTGNGGSGTNNANNGGTGGSGIVVIRWKFQ